MNLTHSYPKTPLHSEDPKYLIIEIKGSHEWIEELQEVVNYEISINELMEFFITQFKNKEHAILNLDYALMEKYIFAPPCLQQENSIIVNECRKLGIKLLDSLETLGCFKSNILNYCFGKVLSKDTFMLWRPDESDIY